MCTIFIYTIPQTEYHIPLPLLYQMRNTGWYDKYLNGSTMRDRPDDPSHDERTLSSWLKRVTDRERETNVLFNDALNTFYLQLYGVRHMVKDHYDSEKGNPLPPHRLLLSINSKGSFICTIPQRG